MVIEQLWGYPVSLSVPFLERLHGNMTTVYHNDYAEDRCEDDRILSCIACDAGGGVGFW